MRKLKSLNKALTNIAWNILESWACFCTAAITLGIMRVDLNWITLSVGTVLFLWLFGTYVNEIVKVKLEKQNETDKPAS